MKIETIIKDEEQHIYYDCFFVGKRSLFMEKKENILGVMSIKKLMIKFSIPCIISLLVNSLYNIVDQIFIGWGVGYLGNGATNVVFPLTMVCLSFALMFGDGASAYLSLKLGEGKKEEASRGVTNGIILSVIVSVLFCAFVLLFLPQLLNLFGCTDALRSYALGYGYIIAIGIPFMMIGTALNSVIRADGNPKYAMTSMIVGAVLNIILDPIFIFVFKWGVEGAALATIISQALTFILNILYIRKFKSVSLTKESFKFSIGIAKKVSMLGISSFITQMSIVLVMYFENNLLSKYGALSKFGAEIPITVLGIVMKISQILNSIIIGIAAGSQPILGYNYGAGKEDRVKKTLKYVLVVSLIISLLAFILFQTIPDKLISIFGSGDTNYMEFACLSFRIYLLLVICNGIQIPAGIFFQAIGKSFKSAVISLSRQVLFLIPAMIVFSSIFGLNGVLYAGPFADALAFVVAGVLLIVEVKHLSKKKNDVLPIVKEKKAKTFDKHIVITIAREYGSGGRFIGKKVAESLGINFYDKELITKLAKETGYSEEFILNNEQKRSALDNFNGGYYFGLSNYDDLYLKEAELIKEIAKRESCVIIGRCSNYILKDDKNILKVFIYSDMEDKVKRVEKYYKVPKADSKKIINKVNKLRREHYKHYTGEEWDSPKGYDVMINSDKVGIDEASDLICNMASKKDK